MLPAGQAYGHNVRFLDCLFTATSAVCVTGLVVVDTATAWTRIGQTTIIILIQGGGIGIITFGALFALLLGHKFGFRQRALIQEQLGDTSVVRITSLLRIVRVVAGTTFVIELLGAILLYPMFAAKAGHSAGMFHAVFHAISAFCNAGFSTFSENLRGSQGHIGVNTVICLLIILGGLGFPVHAELLESRGKRRRLSLHTRVVLMTTIALIIGGAVFIFLFETFAGSAYAGLPLKNRILASIFQSVTARTCGFDTINIGALTPATLVLLHVLMFIGGSPAGTAGGVKTTTFATAIAAVRAVIKGREDVTISDRRLERNTVRRALVLIIGAAGLLTVALVGLLLSGGGSPLQLSFEAVSAFGTVGLSTGITPNLTAVQKIIIILLMFIGRVGPMSFALSLARSRVEQIRFAETDLLTG